MTTENPVILEAAPEGLDKLTLISGSISNATGVQINYWPIEVSQFSFSFITDISPSEILVATLAAQRGQIDLIQVSSQPDYKATGYNLIQFKSRRSSTSIEEALRLVPELKNWNDDSVGAIQLPAKGSYVRAARFDIQHELDVLAKTFGTSANYSMEAKNISKSGVLLCSKGEKAPFKEGTILEITIDPGKRHFSHSVSCLAKVVRSDYQDENSAKSNSRESSFALRLIELDQSTSNLWSEFVDQVEKSNLSHAK